MAKNKVNKKMGLAGVELPECPVCMEVMSSPIFQCQSGHSLCNICTSNLCPPNCPICRQPMTQMRNWQLEDLISKATVPCPNKALGCVFTMSSKDVENHVKECIFREMQCPVGVVFGRCSWSGKLKEILDHFKERHPIHCNINTNNDIELKNISATEDDRSMFIVPQGKHIFILSIKIDTCQKMAYWVIQLIGSKRNAQQHSYEIQVTSAQDERRKVIFADQCFNDAFDINEIFRLGKCGIMPLNMFSHFIKNGKLMFRFDILKHQNNFRNRDTSRGPANNPNRQKGPNPNTNQGHQPQPQKPCGPVPAHCRNNVRPKSPSAFKGPQGQQQGPRGPKPGFKKQNKNS